MHENWKGETTSKRPTRQKWAFQGKMSMPSYAQLCSCDSDLSLFTTLHWSVEMEYICNCTERDVSTPRLMKWRDLFFDVDSGYSDKIWVPICRSRTYNIPITSLDALPLSYRKLVGPRPLNYNHGQIVWNNSAFYLSTHLSHILDSFAIPFPLQTMLLEGNEVKLVCRTESGPVYAQHWLGGEGGRSASVTQWSPKNVCWNECPKGICPWS